MILTKTDLLITLESINKCLACQSPNDIDVIRRVLEQHLGIKGVIAGFQENFDPLKLDQAEVSCFGIDKKWMEVYLEKKLVFSDPIIANAMASENAIVWSDIYKKDPSNRVFQDVAEQHKVVNGMTFATKSHASQGAATIISVSFDHSDITTPQKVMLQQILPHLNEAIARPGLRRQPHLTAKEIEVLKWAKEGKSYWEVGKILNISERTVKFHLQNAYKKLGVLNKSQAVAKAMRLGVLIQ